MHRVLRLNIFQQKKVLIIFITFWQNGIRPQYSVCDQLTIIWTNYNNGKSNNTKLHPCLLHKLFFFNLNVI